MSVSQVLAAVVMICGTSYLVVMGIRDYGRRHRSEGMIRRILMHDAPAGVVVWRQQRGLDLGALVRRARVRR